MCSCKSGLYLGSICCLQFKEEMKTYSCEVILCVSGCLVVSGMIAFRAFKAWRREFGKLTRLQSERPKNILWKSQKEPVENDDISWYDKVSFITNVIELLQKLIISWFPSLYFNISIVLGDEFIITSHLTL